MSLARLFPESFPCDFLISSRLRSRPHQPLQDISAAFLVTDRGKMYGVPMTANRPNAARILDFPLPASLHIHLHAHPPLKHSIIHRVELFSIYRIDKIEIVHCHEGLYCGI